MNNNYIENLPTDLKDRAIWLLEKVGVKEYGWDRNDALLVLEYLLNNNRIILGGDVLEIVNGKLMHVGDNWYYNNDDAKTKEENVTASYLKSNNYIIHYQTHNKGEYVFVLVC
jgi:hypothetical protein